MTTKLRFEPINLNKLFKLLSTNADPNELN